MKQMKPYPSLCLLAVLSSVSCGGGGSGPGAPSSLIAQTVVGNLSFPTALRFLPNGDILVTEKSTGNVRRVSAGILDPNPVFNVAVDANGERGLLGLAIDPNYTVNKFVYIFYTKVGGNENEVLRFTDDSVSLNPTPIVSGLPASNTHNGGRLEFGPDGKLYVTLGDVGNPANAQNANSLAGKVLRYNSSGTIPGDNPIVGNPLFSLGHRNCFGLAIDSASGRVFVSENGPDCDDEVNRLTAGANFGWRPGQPCGDNDPGYAAPLYRLPSVVAPTGMAIGSGVYGNSILMASFNDRKLVKINLGGWPNGNVSGVQTLYTSPSNRIIDVTMGPDGNPYIATTDFGSGGQILRLVP